MQTAWVTRILLTLTVLLGQWHVCSPLHLSADGRECRECPSSKGAAVESQNPDDCEDCCEAVVCSRPDSDIQADLKILALDQLMILPPPLTIFAGAPIRLPVSRPPPEEREPSRPPGPVQGRGPPCHRFA